MTATLTTDLAATIAILDRPGLLDCRRVVERAVERIAILERGFDAAADIAYASIQGGFYAGEGLLADMAAVRQPGEGS